MSYLARSSSVWRSCFKSDVTRPLVARAGLVLNVLSELSRTEGLFVPWFSMLLIPQMSLSMLFHSRREMLLVSIKSSDD